jgi:FkbM family methyltransferase
MLADEHSRALLVELLTYRALGDGHARLPVDDKGFRLEQERIERDLMVERGTLTVNDPFVPRLDRFRLPARGHAPHIELHSHAAAVVSIFALEQYAYSGNERVLRPPAGAVVIDAGACWGDTALYFADLVSGASGGKVYSFEFSPDSLAVLERNLERNRALAERIEVVEHALWDRSGEELSFQALGQLTTLQHGGELVVRTVTLDDFVDQAGIDQVDWVKMDIEGAELPALRGAEQTLRRHRPTLAIAAYHRADDLVSIPAWISALELGYELHLGHSSPGNDETVLFATAPPS